MVNNAGSYFTSLDDVATNTAIQAGIYAGSALWLNQGSPVGAAIAKTSHIMFQFLAQEGLDFVAKGILPESVMPVLLTVSPFIAWYCTIGLSCNMASRRYRILPRNFITMSFYAIPLTWAIRHFYARHQNCIWVCTSPESQSPLGSYQTKPKLGNPSWP